MSRPVMRPPPSIFTVNVSYTMFNSSFNIACMTGKCNQSDEDGEIPIKGAISWVAGTSMMFSVVRVGQEFLHPRLIWSLCIETVPLSVEHCFRSIAYEQEGKRLA